MEEFVKAKVKFTILDCRLGAGGYDRCDAYSAAPKPQAKSGVDRLYVIDCGDGSGRYDHVGRRELTSDSSRLSPGTASHRNFTHPKRAVPVGYGC